MSNQTPAEALAAVLRVVRPFVHFEEREFGRVLVLVVADPIPQVVEKFDPDSKDDLAHVVAMLTPEQRERFDREMTLAIGGTTGAWPNRVRIQPPPADAITAPVSVWLDALAKATEAAD